jgi:hypothetical protein
VRRTDIGHSRTTRARARKTDGSYLWCVNHGIELQRIDDTFWRIEPWARWLYRVSHSFTMPVMSRLTTAVVADPDLQGALTALIATDMIDTKVFVRMKELIG